MTEAPPLPAVALGLLILAIVVLPWLFRKLFL